MAVEDYSFPCVQIQIQLLLKLNYHWYGWRYLNHRIQIQLLLKLNPRYNLISVAILYIQIQLLLKLNARKINLYDFIVLLKVLINKDFTYFLPAIMRFEGI